MAPFDLHQHTHRRYNPLTREWILVSPHRALRPWRGKVEDEAPAKRDAYDPKCYLCPGNARYKPEGSDEEPPRNPQFSGTYVFQNDFSALLPGTPAGELAEEGLFIARAERGICRVVIFSPRHDLTLAEMTAAEIRPVVDTWVDQTLSLAALPTINHVQIFENKGEIMGCSNPHPHGQIWAQEGIPEQPARELASLAEYRSARGGACLLCDYLASEARRGERLVCGNEHFAAVVPFWAVWPFETLVVSRRHVGALPDLTGPERDGLADVLRRLTARYDRLFKTSFPYSMGLHQSPTDGREHPECHLHLHFYPPLLRSARVRKFMVGYEMLGEPQRDITPESSAERLRALGDGSVEGATG